MGIVLFLILTSNGNLMMYIGDAEYDIDIALICLIILIFVICLCQKFRKKYDIVFVVTIGFLIGWIFTSTCCVVILKDPSTSSLNIYQIRIIPTVISSGQRIVHPRTDVPDL